MGRYDAPTDPYQTFEKGCLKVYFPDDPFLFRALMGQLTELESRFMWDTQGDIVAAEKLEQDWLEAGEMTRMEQEDGCPDLEECEQTIIDLTVQLEDCQNQLEEIENMEITVNCNCGCQSNCVPIPPLVNPDDTNVELTPVEIDPNDPFGENVPTWDDVAETPPEGFVDWQDFVDSRCLLANYGVDAFLETARKLDEAENKASVIVDIASLLLLLAPIPVAKTRGFLVAVKWVAKAAAFLNLVEEGFDWLQFVEDFVQDNKEDMICAAYNAASVESAASSWVSSLQSFLAAYPAFVALSQVARDALEEFFVDLLTDVAPLIANAAAKVYIPSGYVAGFDCQACGTSDVWVESVDNVGAVIQRFPLADLGSVTLTAHRSDQYGPFTQFRFTDDQSAVINVTAYKYSITGLNGWVQHNIPQHPFTLQTKQSDGSNFVVDLPADVNIPLPYQIERTTGTDFMGIIEIASDFGTDNFQVTISRDESATAP